MLSCLYNHHYYCFRFLSYLLLSDRTGLFSFHFPVICFINQQLNIKLSEGQNPLSVFKTFLERVLPTWIIKIRVQTEKATQVHMLHGEGIILKLIYKINYEEQLWKKKSSVLVYGFTMWHHFIHSSMQPTIHQL